MIPGGLPVCRRVADVAVVVVAAAVAVVVVVVVVVVEVARPDGSQEVVTFGGLALASRASVHRSAKMLLVLDKLLGNRNTNSNLSKSFYSNQTESPAGMMFYRRMTIANFLQINPLAPGYGNLLLKP